MSDLVAWSPAVSTYMVPGATNINGTIAAGGPTAEKAGAIGVPYPTAPTLAQVQNNFTHWNQAVAMFNYRLSQQAVNFGFPYTPMKYFPPGKKVTASDVTSLQSQVDLIRAIEGFSAYFVGNARYPIAYGVPAIGDKPKGFHLEDCRRAFAISGIAKFSLPQNLNPGFGGAKIQECKTASFGGAFSFGGVVGGIEQGLGVVGVVGVTRNRTVFDVPVPWYASGLGLPQPQIALLLTPRNAINGAFTLQWWNSNTDDFVASAARCGNTNVLQNQIASSSLAIGSQANLSGAPFPYAGKAGSHFSMILATDKELAGISGNNSMDANPVSPNNLVFQVTWF